jgi:dTDP-3-amino-3,4,6-trideoxy-alpha-D-glucose transaminase
VLEQQAPRALTRVPFLDLGAIHAPLKERILAEIGDLIDSNAFVNGPQVGALEAAFARYCGTSECVGLASGLDALRLALLALEIGPGDEVIVPAHTFVATFEAVSQTGAAPVPVDIAEADYGVDVDAVAAAVTPRTRAILPVHLYGQMVDTIALARLAAEHGIPVLEDACQAHGAARDGRRAGTIGAAAAFSFYPGKNLGAFGDAGALVTDDSELASRVRALREHGQRAKYRHDFQGYTARLDSMQALVLLRKLPHLDGWNEERRNAAAFYSERLAGIGDLVIPPVPAGSEPVWHLYVVRTPARDRLAEHLRERGVATGLHYPEPPHLSSAYAPLGCRPGDFPVAEALADECLSLPIFPGISERQLEAVVAATQDFFSRGG